MYKFIAKSYNELYREEQIKKLNLIKEYVKIKAPLLDVGCGTGISTNYFNVKSYGIDNCKEMIREGKESGYKNLSYSDAESLYFKDGFFNTVISVTSLHNFKNIKKALLEIKRVSKNNNIAITFLKKSNKLNYFKKLLRKYFRFEEVDCYDDILFVIK